MMDEMVLARQVAVQVEHSLEGKSLAVVLFWQCCPMIQSPLAFIEARPRHLEAQFHRDVSICRRRRPVTSTSKLKPKRRVNLKGLS